MSRYSNKNKKFKRRFNLHRIKSTQTYSLEEIAICLGVHKNTPIRWLKMELKRIDDERPYLVYGQVLIDFLRNKQEKQRQKCRPHEIFCVKCKTSQIPENSTVTIEIYNSKKLMIKGRCSCCGSNINKVGSVEKLPVYEKLFKIKEVHDRRISACKSSISMCNNNKE